MKKIVLLLAMMLSFALTVPAKADAGVAGGMIAIALAKLTLDGMAYAEKNMPVPACLGDSNKPVMVQAKGGNYYYVTYAPCTK